MTDSEEDLVEHRGLTLTRNQIRHQQLVQKEVYDIKPAFDGIFLDPPRQKFVKKVLKVHHMQKHLKINDSSMNWVGGIDAFVDYKERP